MMTDTLPDALAAFKPPSWRREAALGYDRVPVERRLAVEVSYDAAASLLEHLAELPPKSLHAAELGWDLRRHLGDDGHDLCDLLSLELDGGRVSAAAWDAFARNRLPDDRLLIDLMDDASREGWPLPPEITAALDALRALAIVCEVERNAAAPDIDEEYDRIERWGRQKRKAVDDVLRGETGSSALVPTVNSPTFLPPGTPMPLMSNHSLLTGVPAPGASLTEFAEGALAERFVTRHANDLRFVASWGQWLRWNGVRWERDTTLHAFDLVRAVCREAYDDAVSIGARNPQTLWSAKTVAAVERLAKADRRLAATPEQWDADPWLLNTPDGVVDLRDGRLRDASPADYMTRLAAASPGGSCPTWLAFLARITGSDVELQSFLQRMAGYALTGVTSEHAMFFAYGTGANGKSRFTDALAGMMGDYHTTAPIETFIASSVDRHPTDLAGLMGARLVTAVETEQGRRWAEAKIKTITGGDRVKARFMRQDFFEFTPQFKLLTVGNHKPGLRSVDEAMRRRMNLLPFTVTIPPAERDQRLGERLRAEWPGILAWAIEGCLAWQADGLQPPAAVREATDDYLSAEDAMGTWMEERCRVAGDGWEAAGRLYADWTGWATRAGEFVGSQKAFSQKLLDRGLVPVKRNGVRGFTGIWLRPPDWAEKAAAPMLPVPRIQGGQ